jgi:CRISPR-associated endonuclease/helicase Cas3
MSSEYTRTQGKAARLGQMERFLLASPEGLTQAELARLCGVHRSTIHRSLHDLADQGVPTWEAEDGRIGIDRDAYLTTIRISLDEAMAVFMAARLLARYSDKPNRHTVEALMKLGLSLDRLAPQLAGHILHTSEALRLQLPDQPAEHQVRLETLTRAWSLGRKVQLRYRPLKSRRAFEETFAPYFLEPSAIGYSTYAIGKSDLVGHLRTRKVERIEQVQLTSEPFAVPADFDPVTVLAGAWGVWFDADDAPTRVTLRFSPAVARRVQESRWHPSQRVEAQEDGSLVWHAALDAVEEVVSWVRGWGADCEVLEPSGLREELVDEARRLAQLYGLETSPPRYYAHSRVGEDESKWQHLIDHLHGTAELAASFGHAMGLADLTRIAGLTHDLGKYSREFQERLAGKRNRVDHATAGAQELMARYHGSTQAPLATLLAYCISGHHSGLLDYGDPSDLSGDGTLQARLKTPVCDYSAYKDELDFSALQWPQQLPIHPLKGQVGFSIAFLTRMVYSALVDADFQDTEAYMLGKQPRGGHEAIPGLRDQFNDHLRRFGNPRTEIDRQRTETLRACLDKAAAMPGFFTLTVPTGGGKTLASMAFALNHAAAHGLRRIIYVIPYTSIIEQNGAVFKGIVGETNVLEHHSNFDWDQQKSRSDEHPDDLTNSAYAKLKLAAENWDVPIVVTTNVQFFESLFANKSSRCRKLHNIARSVIVFDEAQMLPRGYMLPAMSAVWELVTNYGASAVICTATQPDLGRFLPEGTPLTELAPDPQALFEFYKRVEVKNLEALTDEDLLRRLNAHEQVVCIVNTRRHASGLFEGLQDEGNFHLSTLMCPAHRKGKLAEIRRRLDAGLPCRVVATSVMEAGIDVDFPVGYRALAGLDSINQAAGRVNRNMRRGMAELFVFEPKSKFAMRIPKVTLQAAEVARAVLREFAQVPISVAAVQAYFGKLYSLHDRSAFDFKNILPCLNDHDGRYKFQTAAQRFRIIEDETTPVIIPFNQEAGDLIGELQSTRYPLSTLRKLQPYTVSIYKNEFDALNGKGVILTIAETYAVLSPEHFQQYYDLDRGLTISADGGGDGLFF